MKPNESMFPIVIDSVGVGRVTFTTPTDGVWDNGAKVSGHHDVDYFLSRAIAHPDQYIVKSIGGNEFPITFYCGDDCGLVTFDSCSSGTWHEGNGLAEEKIRLSIDIFFARGYEIVNGSIKSIVGEAVIDLTYQECAIEDMPIGAKLLGFYHDSELVEIAISPNNIEVHENSYTLLLRHGVSPSRVFAEVNLKRGEMVRYKK